MASWKVCGRAQVNVEFTVEADSEEEAIEKAENEWPGMTEYCGNGGSDKLVGPIGEFDRCSIAAGEDGPEWDEAFTEDDEDDEPDDD